MLTLPMLAKAQDEIYKKVAQETCDCITQKDLSGATKKSIEVALGLCMLESVQTNKIEIDITDNTAMRRFGEKVGVQMAPICPNVFTILSDDDSANDDASSEVFTVAGKVKSVDENEFMFITVKEETGKETRMVWLRHFKGSDEYLSNPRQLVGKKVTVKYRSIDCYLPKAKGYFAYKEIVEMQFK